MAITTPEALRHAMQGFQQQQQQQEEEEQETAVARSSQHLKLELGESSDLPSLSAEIRKHTSTNNNNKIKHLVIGSEHDLAKRHMSEPPWSSHEAHTLFDTLAVLVLLGGKSGGGIESLQLQDLGIALGPQGPRFPITLLSKLLAATAPTLKRLTLRVRLTDQVADVLEFADCLRAQTALEAVVWEEWWFPSSHVMIDPSQHHPNGHPNNNDNDEAAPFDVSSILRALACLPRLQQGSIKAMTAGRRRAHLGWLEGDALLDLLTGGHHASTLKHLELVHFQLSNQTIHEVARVLRNNNNNNNTTTSLESLSLDLSQTSSTAAKALFDVLRSDACTIRALQLWASTAADWRQDDCLLHLADALTHNASLAKLAVVTHSRTLQEAVQNVTVVDDRTAEAFCRALESNGSLQTLVLDDYYDDDESSRTTATNDYNIATTTNKPTNDNHRLKLVLILRFYLTMNTSGLRSNLLERYTTTYNNPGAWVQLLTTAIMHVDHAIQLEMVYFFLRLNPTLCHHPLE